MTDKKIQEIREWSAKREKWRENILEEENPTGYEHAILYVWELLQELDAKDTIIAEGREITIDLMRQINRGESKMEDELVFRVNDHWKKTRLEKVQDE